MRNRLAAGATALLLGACSVVGVRSGTEEPRFELLEQANGLEIRRYAPRLAAETEVAADETASREQGFRLLAGYIFGGNRGSARIAMTAPVAQEPVRIAMTAPVAQSPTASGHRVRFFLPESLRDPPVPNDPRVQVVEVPAETYAVLRFTGSTSPQSVADAQARLRAALGDTAWQASGPATAWFYDPPWTIPALRRNEVAVPVTRR
ncbi:heme-binding protein [Roseomonas frigidaquae]|uniref:Heme-binding protein n=1 Tax=Falsiroseomonas frigidaquae TaxID=487318 RepID=A0ABX1F7Z2_9PROT|nr:heme-binding protein [Falsiroseomonas frigidaquae]NKE48344.1 heme-binding protein [Falsiroseomonas frigidaquae]